MRVCLASIPRCCSSRSTWKASAPPAAPPAWRGQACRRTCGWRWDCGSSAHGPPFDFRSGNGLLRKKSTPQVRPYTKSSNVCTRERANMPLLRQLEFAFAPFDKRAITVGQALRLPTVGMATEAVALQRRGRDANLEKIAADLLCSLGATRIARELRVEWNSRLKSAAGLAGYCFELILLHAQAVY